MIGLMMISPNSSLTCSRCNDSLISKEGDFCNICQYASVKGPFSYKGYYAAAIDEYIPDCYNCCGEGWFRNPITAHIVACKCNPEKLSPRD